jgi:hypothetical protein
MKKKKKKKTTTRTPTRRHLWREGRGAYTEEKEGRLCKIAVEEVVEGEHAILGLVELLEQLLGCRGVVAHRGRVLIARSGEGCTTRRMLTH